MVECIFMRTLRFPNVAYDPFISRFVSIILIAIVSHKRNTQHGSLRMNEMKAHTVPQKSTLLWYASPLRPMTADIEDKTEFIFSYYLQLSTITATIAALDVRLLHRCFGEQSRSHCKKLAQTSPLEILFMGKRKNLVCSDKPHNVNHLRRRVVATFATLHPER